MNISEFILELEKIKEEHGDLSVSAYYEESSGSYDVSLMVRTQYGDVLIYGDCRL